MNGISSSSLGPPGSPLQIGVDIVNDAQNFDGEIANIQIYNSTLSSNEIQALYLEGIGGAPIQTQNLVNWWPLNGNAQDYSGNDNNGQATGVTYTGSWETGYSTP